MTLLQWFIFFLALQVVHYLGTWKLYQKAGRKSWEAAVPVYNAIVLMRIIRRPRWWVILLFIPVVNLIMFPVIWVQTLRNFGKTSAIDYILGVVTLGVYIYYINYFEDVTYVNNTQYNQEKTGDGTLGSLLFAIVVATIVHTYVMQPFTIPTASLEKTLLIGDFLFVSKFHYGARTPMTAVAAPMVHDTIPIAGIKSYTNWPQLPSFRFPGFEKIEKNDIVVFNWPVDTVRFFGDRKTVGLRKPIDKRSNYVKRCVGTPGDTLSIIDGTVHIDGKELMLSDRARLQYFHIVYAKPGIVSEEMLRESGSTEFGITGDNKLIANLTLEGAEKLRSITGIDSIIRRVETQADSRVFPHTKPWTADNMGPVYIPEAGKTVELNNETLPFYKMIIKEYEGNTLEVKGSEIIINGQPATSYTFKQNYYWMMGDNRHNSEDSRFWGFVPENHVVGKPVFIWMSIDQNESWKNIGDKIRWERLFTTVGGEGKPVSYFKYFLALLAAWFIFDYFRKKKKAKA